MKVDISDRDLNELEEAEYEEGGQYESYDGEQPPVGTELLGYIKKIWWTYSGNDDDMLKILFIADGNEGEEEEFNGCPIWENYSLIPTMKFKWAPFLDALGLSIRDVIKKTFVEEEEDGKNGQPITKIGTWVPGSDESYCRVITTRHKFNDGWQTDVDIWMPYEDEGEEPEPEPEPEPARPTARSSRSKSSADGAGKPSRSGRRASKAEVEEPEDEEPEDEEPDDDGDYDDEPNEEAEQGGGRTGSRGRAGKPSRAPGGARAGKPAARGRGRRDPAGVASEEVPF
jgi:hypothetical protein